MSIRDSSTRDIQKKGKWVYYSKDRCWPILEIYDKTFKLTSLPSLKKLSHFFFSSKYSWTSIVRVEKMNKKYEKFI